MLFSFLCTAKSFSYKYIYIFAPMMVYFRLLNSFLGYTVGPMVYLFYIQ